MSHKHFKIVRDIIFIFMAIMMAGYPYLYFTSSLFESQAQFVGRGLIIVLVLLLSFGGVALAAHKEYLKRRDLE